MPQPGESAGGYEEPQPGAPPGGSGSPEAPPSYEAQGGKYLGKFFSIGKT